MHSGASVPNKIACIWALRQCMHAIRTGQANPKTLTMSPDAPQPTWHPKGCTVGYVMQHRYATSLKDIDTRWLGGVACV